ncbi:unnamed protein product [Rotaria sordida]|uniref:Uncharacterized protein n=1 Tax=Rotaria sordida TaxID=392033 RepID=A0A819T4G3_9BILA|nr:unnamed protein product [Rotaria sordida]CAF4075482.1 unnamed protein product [Rotaria sordida]
MEHGFELIELPVGTILHKAMKVPSSGLPSQTDILNTYAAKNSWLANLLGAKQYADWGYGDIVHFQVIKKIKLFDITSASNWKMIWSKMDSQLKSLRERNIPSDKIIQLTIGYGVTWEQQQKLLLEFGDAITNDFTYHPQDEIKKRNSHPNDWFSINGKPTVLMSKTTTFGWRNEDLNRVSFTTALDNIMADAITEFVNVDGYYSSKFPSLFHGGGALNAEIAIRVPRDTLKIMDIACKNDSYPCGSKCYNVEEQECLPGGLLERF